MTSQVFPVPSSFTVDVRTCCGVLLGEVHECAGNIQITPPANPTVEHFALVDGRLQRVEPTR